MSGKGKQVNSTARAIIYSVYKYFERECTKSKSRGPPKLTFKTAKATAYSEHTVRRVVAEKSAISGAAFTSLAKRYKIDMKRIVLEETSNAGLVDCTPDWIS